MQHHSDQDILAATFGGVARRRQPLVPLHQLPRAANASSATTDTDASSTFLGSRYTQALAAAEAATSRATRARDVCAAAFLKFSEVYPNLISFGVSEHCGYHRRTMEDFMSVFIPTTTTPPPLFVSVFDGHGGHCVAELLATGTSSNASSGSEQYTTPYNLLERISDRLAQAEQRTACATAASLFLSQKQMSHGIPRLSWTPDTLPTFSEIVKHEFETYDKTVLQRLHTGSGGKFKTCGSTTTVCKIEFVTKIDGSLRNAIVQCASVGDSEMFLIRRRCIGGKTVTAERVSIAHDPASEIDRISEAGGLVFGKRLCGALAVSRAFGDFGFKGSECNSGLIATPMVSSKVSVFGKDPDCTDAVLAIASDGLWNGIPSAADFANELYELLDAGVVLQQALDDICKRASSESRDNTSAIALRFIRSADDNS